MSKSKKLFSLIAACATMFLQSVSVPMYAMENNKPKSNLLFTTNPELRLPETKEQVEEQMFQVINDIRTKSKNKKINNAITKLINDGFKDDMQRLGIEEEAADFIITLLRNSLLPAGKPLKREKFEIVSGNIESLTVIVAVFNDVHRIIFGNQSSLNIQQM